MLQIYPGIARKKFVTMVQTGPFYATASNPIWTGSVINALVPGRFECDLKMQFPIYFYWLVSSDLSLDECHGTQKAFTWTNVDPVLRRYLNTMS